MRTPIYDFTENYIKSGALRLHMPGHKGTGDMAADITEIDGADSLYEAAGIIRESEKNAGTLFGGETFYSTEGSSQCIRAMLYLATLYAEGNRRIFAGRNAHKAFISAAALLDLEVTWLYGHGGSYLSCEIDGRTLEAALQGAAEKPSAVYVTSPDYLGNMLDVAALSAVCRKHGVLLLVDNAHGAYLKFLPESLHPLDAGADMCCDSAHKTLPVLTGGAYLHIRREAAPLFAAEARRALALFGSTSPSYLILQSLDKANPYLLEYPKRLAAFIREADACREALTAQGYSLIGRERLKLCIDAKKYGYSGTALARILSESNIICEFADPDFLVLMITPETGSAGLAQLTQVLLSVPRRPEITEKPPCIDRAERVLSIREAVLAPRETVPITEGAGRILAAENVGCPPAVPLCVAGERIDPVAVEGFQYYGIEHCTVVKEQGCAHYGTREAVPYKV